MQTNHSMFYDPMMNGFFFLVIDDTLNTRGRSANTV